MGKRAVRNGWLLAEQQSILRSGVAIHTVLEGDDDGTVSVAETKLPGATDYTLVKNTHTLLLFDPETVEQTIHFLKVGKFQKVEPKAQSPKPKEGNP